MRDQIGLDETAVVGRPFSLLVDRGSFRKALNFLVTLRTERAVYDWELRERSQITFEKKRSLEA